MQPCISNPCWYGACRHEWPYRGKPVRPSHQPEPDAFHGPLRTGCHHQGTTLYIMSAADSQRPAQPHRTMINPCEQTAPHRFTVIHRLVVSLSAMLGPCGLGHPAVAACAYGCGGPHQHRQPSQPTPCAGDLVQSIQREEPDEPGGPDQREYLQTALLVMQRSPHVPCAGSLHMSAACLHTRHAKQFALMHGLCLVRRVHDTV